jgi:hypothetical protein
MVSMASDEPPRLRWYEVVRRETYYYCLFGVPLTAVLLVVLLVAATPVILVWDVRAYARLARDAAVFALILVTCGIPANAAFVLLCRGRLYVPGDPIVDWLPWVPSGDWTIGRSDGGHYLPGGRASKLRIYWAVLAIPTWIVAWVLYETWHATP